MVRTEHLSRSGKRPRGVRIPITDRQKKARDSMLDRLVSSPPIGDDILVQTLHQLCNTILIANLSDAPKLGYAFELALCIYSHHHFLNASQVSQLFAGMQSCFCLTLAHIIQLNSQGAATYIDPPNSPPPDEGNTATHSQSISEDLIQGDNHDGEVISDEVEWLEFELDEEVGVVEKDTMLETSTREGDQVSSSLLQ